MIERLIVLFLANISEELLSDVIKAISREIRANRKKEKLKEAVEDLKKAVKEKDNEKITNAGRAAIARMRDDT